MTTAIVPGSISALAQQSNKSLAESFLSADCICIVDVSGSMNAQDSHGGQSRYDVACQELAALQRSLPGKVAVIAFSNDVQFCPGGQPIMLGGGTHLAAALRFAKVADVPGMRFIVISDGEPDDEGEALRVAKTYQNKISTVFVGPEQDWSGGRAFLARLAQASGGQSVTADRAKELAASVERLLLTA